MLAGRHFSERLKIVSGSQEKRTLLHQTMVPSEPTDPELLAAWLRRGSELAFRDLVERYAGLVQATAMRTGGEASLAAEAAQLTFITLARRARSLASCASLGGWLHQTALLHVKNLQRSQQRELRKRQSFRNAMEHPHTTREPAWRELQPVLDGALAALPDRDREVLLLRFYRALPMKQVAETLGIATDAAQKRIERATERLRLRLTARGVTASGSLAGVMLAGFAADVQAAAPSVAAISAKALGNAGTGFSITAFAAKAAPFAAMLAAVVWLTLQFHAIASLEDETALERRTAEAPSERPVAKTTAQVRGVLDARPINWQEVARQFRNRRVADAGGFLFIDTAQRLSNGLLAMSREELITSLDEVAAARLSKSDRALVEMHLLAGLEDKSPRFVLEWGVAQGSADHALLEKWTLRNPSAAAAWYDREVAARRIKADDLKPFMAVTGALLASDPAEAVRRFQSLPEERRHEAIYDLDFGRGWNAREWKEHDPVAGYAMLARLLPEESRMQALSAPVTDIGETDRGAGLSAVQHQLDAFASAGPGEVMLSTLQDYLRRIGAAPEERQAIVSEVKVIGLPTDRAENPRSEDAAGHAEVAR
jgi:RNA polymerase sigma factor (sigma-70 family)